MHELDTTVVAVATPPGRGGVGCVRLSGERAAEIASHLFRGAAGDGERAGSLRFGRFLDRRGRALDHGYLVVFEPGRSFTGERTAELWPHGSPAVLRELTAAAVEAGARAAEPGEFTYRALRNGRLDLTRAEAVRDLVDARTAFQARVAFAQTEGALARRLEPVRAGLEEWIARAEAAVEFVDESETPLARRGLSRGIAEIRRLCTELLAGFSAGKLVREGARLVLVGRPNAGKSSLFNRLLAEERAIVTATAGTTRDTLEETVELDGVPLRLVDTAGLRDVDDPIESEGVRRARAARREADLVLVVLDGERDLGGDPRALAELVGDDRRTLVLVNKIDRVPDAVCPEGALPVSAVTGEGLDALRDVLRRRLFRDGPVECPVISDVRHARALELTLAAVGRAAEADAAGLSEELVLEDLKEAMERLGTITGEFGNEDLYDRIFSTFCIGK